MEDARRHGQDIRLTLTADIETTDDELSRIAETLKPFGRVELRRTSTSDLPVNEPRRV